MKKWKEKIKEKIMLYLNKNKRLNELSLELTERSNQEDIQLSQLQKAEVVEENYRAMQLSSENLRNELSEALDRNSELSSKLREAQNHNR